MSQMPLLAVILLNWHNSADTLECLRQLAASDYPRLQPIVVDNGSHDDSVARLQATFPRVPLIRSPINRGFAGGVNQGLQYAAAINADYALLLNSDVSFAPDMLRKLLVAATADGPGLYTPRLLRETPPRSLHVAVRQRLARLPGLAWLRLEPPSDDYLWVHGLQLRNYGFDLLGEGACDRGQFDDVPIDLVYGCALLIPRPVLLRLGLLDDRFFFFAEDLDYCLRARIAGLPVRVVPAARLRHAVHGSTRNDSQWRQFLAARSRVLLLRKHQRLFRRVALLRRELLEGLRIVVISLRYLDLGAIRGYLRGVIAGLREQVF
jgi:GT2 family glycosyltransferase